MKPANSLPRKVPESLGVSSRAILGFIESIERSKLELHSFMLLRHGSVAAEGWWAPYKPELRHMLYSLSKSFASTGVGLAVMEGRLSVEDPVISFFPDQLPAEISDNLAAMRVRHLLSMSAGHAEDTTNRLFASKGPAWTKTFLELPVENPPGTRFVYNSGATYMLSAIITKLTGQTLCDYLAPRLFEPLGIEDYLWECSPEGINTGGWGLSIRTEDIAKLGQLYLDKGMWNGKRIVSEEWVSEATSIQISNGDGGASDWAQGYGYQFWMSRHGAYRGDGMFGQFCIVMPGHDAVVAITASVKDMQGVLNCVWDHLLPAMSRGPLPEDRAGQETLGETLESLAIPVPVDRSHSVVAQRISGKRFPVTIGDGLQCDLAFSFREDKCTIHMYDQAKQYSIDCGLGNWIESEVELPGRTPVGTGPTKVAASCGWSDDRTLEMTFRLIETPHRQQMICHLEADKLQVEMTRL